MTSEIDRLRAERDKARAALRDIGEQFYTPRPFSTTERFVVLLTLDEERGICVTGATAAAIRVAMKEKP